jgi:hypothetical protein
MPSTSKKQHNFMAAIANSPSFAKKVGVPQSVGKDFITADKGRKFSKGGDTMANTSRMNRLEELGRVNAEKAYTPRGKANLTAEKKRVVGELKMAKGGMSESKATVKKEIGFLKKAGAPKSMIKHEMAEGKMAKGGMAASSMSKVKTAAPSRDGVASKGKTKGMMPKMAGSGVPNGIGSRVMKKGGMAKC